ncbi:MAG: hypothetical protein ACR2OU_13265 [Thermomicrobiales bacterium]
MQTVRDEIAAINRGEGRKLLGNRYEINGRVYVQKTGGTFFPASGPGFIGPIDRGTHASLPILKEHGGMTEAARFRITREGYSDDQVQLAEEIWNLRRKEFGDDLE